MQGPVQIDFSGTKQDNEVKLSLKGTSSSYLLLNDKSDDLDLHVLSGQGQGHEKCKALSRLISLELNKIMK